MTKKLLLLSVLLTTSLVSTLPAIVPARTSDGISVHSHQTPASQPAIGARTRLGGRETLTISGTVAAEGGGGLAGIEVRILDTGGNTFNLTTTDGSGSYVLSDLSAGSYVLWTRNEQGYIDELYDDIPCAGGCYYFAGTPVHISDGNSASGIDFLLRAGGRISGRVTASSGGGIADVDVRIYNDQGDFITQARSSATGEYLSPTGLPTGDYYLRSNNSQGYFDEIWDNHECTGACDPLTGDSVSVVQGSTTSNIDFVLNSGGGISGVVTSSGDGAPIDQVHIDVYDAEGSWVSSATPDATGFYTTEAGLAPGTYFAKTDNWWGHIDEVYDNIPCAAGCSVVEATPITVAGGITTGVDFVLDPGGWITGALTDSTNSQPIEDAGVEVFTIDGRRVTTAFPNASGVYWASGLPTGSYFLRAYSWGYYLPELYDNLPCLDGCDLSNGTVVNVTQPTITSGIDFELDSGGTIRGNLVEASAGTPVSDAEIQIFDDTGMPVISFLVDQFGAFDSGPIPSGEYYLLVDVWGENLVDEIYDDLQCAGFCDPEVGDLIDLAAGETRNLSIDVSTGATLKVTVTSEDLSPIVDCEVDLFDTNGDFTAVGFSDGTGLALLDGLPGGSYYVRTRNGGDYVDQLWEDIECPGECDPSSGTALFLSPGATSTAIDMFLGPARLFSDGFETATTGEWSDTQD